MSTRYQHGDRVPSDVLAKRLDELADAVGQGPEVRDREFSRRIPAELDRDADLVLDESARRIRELEGERKALTEDAERYRYLLESGAFQIMSPDMSGKHTWTGMGRPVGRGSTLDEAIDAEIRRKDGEVGDGNA